MPDDRNAENDKHVRVRSRLGSPGRIETIPDSSSLLAVHRSSVEGGIDHPWQS